MSYMKQLVEVVEAARTFAETLLDYCNSVEGLGQGDVSSLPEKAEVRVAEEEKLVDIVEVRKLLAEKSKAGKTEEIRKLLQKFGASKLSEIEPSQYAQVMKEGEAL
ncbi:hypothetical protein [Streptococcus acidominimus]|uniref:Phage protein n=1 Tax=Streptococcus acidominimus TaxID=1326 RepID=A0A1Q8EBF6_STRAI|nr:hypothetical protein [Streptococcus acidominimus]OLF49129.1 hypothetical protein BU200_08960 [Streptococcus acidominimus]SUN06838.1 phage protein [Streptococcus acidominimus]